MIKIYNFIRYSEHSTLHVPQVMEDSVQDELDLQLRRFQAVIKYIDHSGNLNLIKAQCEKYKKANILVYTFKLLINPNELSESEADLGNLVIREPILASKLFQEVIYKLILVLNLLSDISLAQVAVIVRLSCLPILSNINIISSVQCLSQVHHFGVMCRLVGIVVGVSAVSTYTQHTRYYCPDVCCDGNRGNHFIRVHTLGASEAQTIRKDFKCVFCGDVLKEEKSSRSLSDRLVAEILPIEAFKGTGSVFHGKTRGQAVPVYVRDDLTKSVKIGETYEVIGMVRRDILDSRITLTVEANNIQKMKKKAIASKLLESIPRNVLKLYRDRKSSPWSFVLTLAYLFCGDICPAGSYFSLKLHLLLSLMSQLDTKTKPLHVLALGQDTELISKLMRHSQMYSDRVTIFSAGQSLNGRVTEDKYNSAAYFIEGGVLHLAHTGICHVGEMGRLKKSVREQLQSAVSGQKVATTIGARFTGGLPQYLEQPLSCRVLGYSDPTCPKRTNNINDDIFNTAETGDLSKLLLDSFSLLCFTDIGDQSSSQWINHEIMKQLLLSSMMPDHKPSTQPISYTDFEHFLNFAACLRPKFRSETETLIHNYYLSCRKSRQSPVCCIPQSAHQTLLSLAYSHAKLALRTEVMISDALMAIKIYEEILSARYGISTLGLQPLPHVTEDLMEMCIGPSNDKWMDQFHQKLLRYCTLASGFEE